jgi:hypothetical protein
MLNKQSTSQKLKNRQTVNNKSLITGTVLAFFIASSPYFFYLYQGVPEVDVWDSPFGTITSNHYGDVSTMMWVFLGKLIPFILLLIWFFTCKHWWYHVIIIPICMYAFQIYSSLNEDIKFSDIQEIYLLAPIIFFILIFSYTIRTRVFDKIHGIDLSELNRVNWKGELSDNQLDIESNKASTSTDAEPIDDDNDPVYMAQ